MLEGDITRMVVQTVISDCMDTQAKESLRQNSYKPQPEKGIVWDLPLPLTIPVTVFLRWVGRRATARHWYCKGIQY